MPTAITPEPPTQAGAAQAAGTAPPSSNAASAVGSSQKIQGAKAGSGLDERLAALRVDREEENETGGYESEEEGEGEGGGDVLRAERGDPLQEREEESDQLYGEDGGPNTVHVVSAPNMHVIYVVNPYTPKNPNEGEITIRVPSDFVGRIIGRGGSTIRELQDRTGAFVYMPKEEDPESPTRVLHVAGTPHQAHFCSLLLQLKMTAREDEVRTSAIIAELRKFQPFHMRQVFVPTEHVGRVIGKGGQTIRQLQDISGASIHLPKDSEVGEDFRRVTISGHPVSVQYCEQMLVLKITPREEGGTAGPGPAFPPPIFDPNAIRIHVFDEHVGRIIGKKGTHIKEIQEMSGATIYLPKECIPGTNVREVVINGTREAISKCQQMLQEKMAPPGQDPIPLMVIPAAWSHASFQAHSAPQPPPPHVQGHMPAYRGGQAPVTPFMASSPPFAMPSHAGTPPGQLPPSAQQLPMRHHHGSGPQQLHHFHHQLQQQQHHIQQQHHHTSHHPGVGTPPQQQQQQQQHGGVPPPGMMYGPTFIPADQAGVPFVSPGRGDPYMYGGSPLSQSPQSAYGQSPPVYRRPGDLFVPPPPQIHAAASAAAPPPPPPPSSSSAVVVVTAGVLDPSGALPPTAAVAATAPSGPALVFAAPATASPVLGTSVPAPGLPSTATVSLSPDSSVVVLQIREEQVGRLLGKGGHALRQIQEDSGAVVELGPPSPGQAGHPVREVRVIGSPSQVNFCRSLINGRLF